MVAGHDVLLGRAGDDALTGDNGVRTETHVDAKSSKHVKIGDLIGDDLELRRRTDELDGGDGENAIRQDHRVLRRHHGEHDSRCDTPVFAGWVRHFVLDLGHHAGDDPNRHISVGLDARASGASRKQG